MLEIEVDHLDEGRSPSVGPEIVRVAAISHGRREIGSDAFWGERKSVCPVERRRKPVGGGLGEKREKALLFNGIEACHLLCHRTPIYPVTPTHHRALPQLVRKTHSGGEVPVKPMARCHAPDAQPPRSNASEGQRPGKITSPGIGQSRVKLRDFVLIHLGEWLGIIPKT